MDTLIDDAYVRGAKTKEVQDGYGRVTSYWNANHGRLENDPTLKPEYDAIVADYTNNGPGTVEYTDRHGDDAIPELQKRLDRYDTFMRGMYVAVNTPEQPEQPDVQPQQVEPDTTPKNDRKRNDRRNRDRGNQARPEAEPEEDELEVRDSSKT
jgi:hypothetical protein